MSSARECVKTCLQPLTHFADCTLDSLAAPLKRCTALPGGDPHAHMHCRVHPRHCSHAAPGPLPCGAHTCSADASMCERESICERCACSPFSLLCSSSILSCTGRAHTCFN